MADQPATNDAAQSFVLTTLAISATFTAEPVEEALSFWQRELGWNQKITFAPYHQVFQALLDPGSVLATNRDGINLLLVRWQDWGDIEANRHRLIDAVSSFAGKSSVPLVIAFCPASPGHPDVSTHDEAVREQFRGTSGVHVITSTELMERYPATDYHDPHGEELGHVPYTPEFFAALATMVCRKVAAISRSPYKVIVLDCDDTLWQGICGEDGPEGVKIDPPRRILQEFMAEQQASGRLLAICSKNNEEDVVETFRVHPEMPLRWEQFSSRRINWDPKAPNLASIAAELNLSLDSFLFVDDNPKECAEAQANLPEITPVALPLDVERIPEFLRHFWAFDLVKATAEDKMRGELYAQEAERGRLRQRAASLEEFLASLGLRIEIRPMAPEQAPRVAQLTQRTNQMNASTIRRSEPELAALLRSGELECAVVDVADRFGSYGLVGVMLYRRRGDALVADTFLLSCRALGRGVEHRMISWLGQTARDRGLAYVEIPFAPTAKNRPAHEFLASINPASPAVGEAFRFTSGLAAGLAYHPSASTPDLSPSSETVAARLSGLRIDYARIANELARPQQILAAIRASKQPLTVAPMAEQPHTPLEERLAVLWGELLNLPSVGVNDNFFDLGGHSLLAVQLLSRVRQEFGADLTLEVVYSGALTVAELAKAIELNELQQADAEEYAALLAEIENLSDEEVRAMLAEEESKEG